MCDLCDIIINKYKKGIIIVKKYFSFMRKLYMSFMIFLVPTIEKLSFHLSHVRILGSMEWGKNRNYCFRDNASKNNIKLKIIMQKNSEKSPVQKYRVNIGVEIDNYQCKVLMLNIFQLLLILVTAKKNMNSIHI